MNSRCKAAGCGDKHYAKGFCGKHYKRFRSGGDPNTPSRLEFSMEERFREKLAAQDPVTGCIVWSGSRHNPPLRFFPGQRLSPNGTIVIPFECEDVPEGAVFSFAADDPDLAKGGLLCREILNTSMVSKYAFFTPPLETPDEAPAVETTPVTKPS